MIEFRNKMILGSGSCLFGIKNSNNILLCMSNNEYYTKKQINIERKSAEIIKDAKYYAKACACVRDKVVLKRNEKISFE